MTKLLTLCTLLLALVLQAQTPDQIKKLPAPDKDGGMSLMKALSLRKSSRSFNTIPLTDKQVSNLLWAANGFNRDNLRTAPSAMNSQEIEVYMARKDGLWFYDAKAHSIIMIHNKDIRKETGLQPFVGEAPVNLIFVADKTKPKNPQVFEKYADADAACCAENAYLYCASAGLACVLRGAFRSDILSSAMQLPSTKVPIFCMTVGQPK
jgi:nitroreductase